MIRRALAPSLLALLLCGCVSVGPDYKRPQFDAPAAWTDASAPPAAAAPGLEQAAWWKAFKDPVLDELMDRAVKGNLDVAKARARIAQARATLGASNAGAFPAVTGGGSTTSSYSDSRATAPPASQDSMTPSDPGTIWQAGFDVAWEIDVLGKNRRQRESSRASLAASQEDMRATVLTLLGDVASNYVDLRQRQKRLAISRDAARSQSDNVDVTGERFRIGLTSQLDVSQARAQLATTMADIPQHEAQISKDMHRLEVLLGQEPGSLNALLKQDKPLPEPGTVLTAGLPSELLARRPDLRRLERQLAASSADIGVATAALYPTFDLTMGLGLQGNFLSKFLGLANWYWSAIPAVSTNIFDAGKARSGVDQKKALYDEALASYRSGWLTALEEVENALVSLSTERRRVETLQTAVTANEEALSLARERYTRGLTTFLDVLSAEKSLYEAQDSLCQSRANLLTDTVSLYKALGGGWDAPGMAAVSGA